MILVPRPMQKKFALRKALFANEKGGESESSLSQVSDRKWNIF